MKKKDPSFMIAAFAMFIAIGLVTVLSVKTAKKEGYARGFWAFSFGGKAELRNTIEIPLSEAESLELEYGSKNIRVYPAEDEKITIKEYLYSDNPKARAEVARGADKKVKVAGGHYRNLVIFGFFVGEGERIEVYVPEEGLKEFSLQSGSGNITLKADGIKADGVFTARAGSGNINAEGLDGGSIEIETGSGNIKAQELTGENIAVDAGSGNIDVEELTAENVCIEAGSGNITTDVNDVTGKMELETGSGNIRVNLPKELKFHFTGNTGSGNIHTDFNECLLFDDKEKRAEGDIGDMPALKIAATTKSGNMNIRYR